MASAIPGDGVAPHTHTHTPSPLASSASDEGRSSPSTSVSRSEGDGDGANGKAQHPRASTSNTQQSLDDQDMDAASRAMIEAMLAEDRRPVRRAARRVQDAGDVSAASDPPPAKRVKRSAETQPARPRRSAGRPARVRDDDEEYQVESVASTSRQPGKRTPSTHAKSRRSAVGHDSDDDYDPTPSASTSRQASAKKVKRTASTARPRKSAAGPSSAPVEDSNDEYDPPSAVNRSASTSRPRRSATAGPSSAPIELLDDTTTDADISASTGRPQRRAATRGRQSYRDAVGLQVHDAEDPADDYVDPDHKASRTKRPAKGKSATSKANARRDDPTEFQFVHDGNTYEYQSRRCHGPRYSKWPQCSSCVAKLTGDTCRFMGIRVFPCDTSITPPHPFDFNGPDAQSHAPFLASERYASVHFDYPPASSFFPTSNDASIASIKAIAAQSLLPTMRAELDHASRPNTLWRKPELEIRPQCDFCLTSLFSSSYICRCCGREYCIGCADEIANHVDEDGRNSRYVCRFARRHSADDLVPLTRLRLDEVRDEVREMRKILETSKGAISQSSSEPSQEWNPPSHIAKFKNITGPEADSIVGSHVLTEFPHDVGEDAFRAAWAKGDPVVIHDCIPELRGQSDDNGGEGTTITGDSEVPNNNDKVDTTTATTPAWGPWSFTSGNYTTEQCYITRCDQDATIAVVTVADFFSTFGKPAEEKKRLLGKGIWKLKDWPPSSAFDDTFPDLYRHFNAALPMPDYTRRDGRMNISAHFPKNANVPDLGPKMYNAWPSREDQKAKGSTRLHMDIADAVNIMYYAGSEDGDDQETTSTSDTRHGTAAWDIFPASDSQKIRHYLRATRPNIPAYEDPIHSQSHFLDSNDRRSLYESYDVRSWRIYQRPGDAVFIPAGCAHQVCNLTDCMKIAVDFVSPENVARCFVLTEEFRKMSNTVIKSWKEDVLQLKSMLWHAWRAARVMQGHVYGSSENAKKGPDRMDKPIELKTINGTGKGKRCGPKAAVKSKAKKTSAAPRKRTKRSTSATSADPVIISDTDEAVVDDKTHDVISINSDSDAEDDEEEDTLPSPANRRRIKRRIVEYSDEDDDDDGEEDQSRVDEVQPYASRLPRDGVDEGEDESEDEELWGGASVDEENESEAGDGTPSAQDPERTTPGAEAELEHGQDQESADIDVDIEGPQASSDVQQDRASPVAQIELKHDREGIDDDGDINTPQAARSDVEMSNAHEDLTTQEAPSSSNAQDAPDLDLDTEDDLTTQPHNTTRLLSYTDLLQMTDRTAQEEYLSALRHERLASQAQPHADSPTSYEVSVQQAFDVVNHVRVEQEDVVLGPTVFS